MPSSSACRTHAVAASSSTCDPWVSQLPYAISELLSPLPPRFRVFIGLNLGRARSGGSGGPSQGHLGPHLGRPLRPLVGLAAHLDEAAAGVDGRRPVVAVDVLDRDPTTLVRYGVDEPAQQG